MPIIMQMMLPMLILVIIVGLAYQYISDKKEDVLWEQGREEREAKIAAIYAQYGLLPPESF